MSHIAKQRNYLLEALSSYFVNDYFTHVYNAAKSDRKGSLTEAYQEKVTNYIRGIKSVQKIHNNNLDIEGILLTMYDSRLRLSNQVVEEVKTHFQEMVFNTIIQRNVRLSEAPSFGQTIIMHDANSKGAINYLNLAKELLEKNKTALQNQ